MSKFVRIGQMFNRVLSSGITVNTVTNAGKTITNVIDDAGNLIKNVLSILRLVTWGKILNDIQLK